MATYEYKCLNCAVTIELNKSINDETRPRCCGIDMNQVYYSPATQFKGKGWGAQ